jgi:hypothetical protein
MATATRPRTANKGMSVEVVHKTLVRAGEESHDTVTVVIAQEKVARPPRTCTADRTLTFAAPDVAPGRSQFLIGWAPGRGSDRNATVTEAVEW